MILYNHIDYDKLSKDWTVHKDLFEGEHETLTKPQYLWYHELERTQQKGADVIRSIREQRTQYVNFYAPILSRFVSLIFKEKLEVSKEVADLFGDERNDVDGNGTSLEEFTQKVAHNYFLYGWPVIIVDAMERGAGNRPFFELVNPLGVVDWQINPTSAGFENGIDFLRTQYHEIGQRTSSADEPKRVLKSKEYAMTAEGYKVFEFESEGEKDSGKHDWKVVEEYDMAQDFVTIATLERQSSFMQAVAPQVLLAHNTQSALDNALLYQAYQRMIIAGDLGEAERLALTEFTTTYVPEGSTVTVIEPGVFTSLERRYDVTVMNIFRTAFNQTKITSADSRQVESAENQREQKEDLLAKLQTAANEIESVINRAIRYYANYKGNEDFEHKVNINDDITIEDINETLMMYTTYSDRIRRYPTWQKQMDIRMAQRMGLDKSEEIIEEINETEDVSLDERRSAIADAFIAGGS